MDRFLFFGDAPGERLTDLSGFKTVKHSRANAQGKKAERPNIKVVPKGRFEVIESISGLVERLFGKGADVESQTRHNDGVPRLIADHDLKPEDLPAPDADWDVISEFALTCNGYERREDVGDFVNSASAAYRKAGRLPEGLDLAAARDCLFFEQRASRQANDDPDAELMIYIHTLVDFIRAQILVL